jgi:hypothetical protein
MADKIRKDITEAEMDTMNKALADFIRSDQGKAMGLAFKP